MFQLLGRRCLSPDPEPGSAPSETATELRSAMKALEKRLDEMNTRLTAAERAGKAYAVAFEQVERKLKTEVMPEGSWYGTKF